VKHFVGIGDGVMRFGVRRGRALGWLCKRSGRRLFEVSERDHRSAYVSRGTEVVADTKRRTFRRVLPTFLLVKGGRTVDQLHLSPAGDRLLSIRGGATLEAKCQNCDRRGASLLSWCHADSDGEHNMRTVEGGT
jgi:hypothetical protein